jgi:hypothetical protein
MSGREALNFLDEVGIQAKLQNGSCLRFPRQLGIDRLVGPIAEGARQLDPAQNVDTPDPPAMSQGALHDHLYALFHRSNRIGDCRTGYFDALDPDDFKPELSQMINIVLFVEKTTRP